MKIDNEVLDRLKGRTFKIINWYFYTDEEEGRRKEIRDVFNVSDDYKIIGRCTLLGDIVVFYNGRIGVINHDEPEEEPLVMTKNIVKFGEFVDLLEEIPDYAEEKDIKALKKIKKQIKSIRKKAPKNLKDDFDESIYDIEDLIEDIEDGL